MEESATAEVSNNNDENGRNDYEFGHKMIKITVGQVGTGIKPAMIVLANELIILQKKE